MDDHADHTDAFAQVGLEADFHANSAGCDEDGHVRMVLSGNVAVATLYGGDVGSDGPYFLESFGQD